MSAGRVRSSGLLLALPALLTALLLPSLHVDAAHHAGSGSDAPALVAPHDAGTGHAEGAAADPDTCSLCRAAGQARSLLIASHRAAGLVPDGATGGLPVADSAQLPDELPVSGAGPRAPPFQLLQH